jgi:hypothetical protein
MKKSYEIRTIELVNIAYKMLKFSIEIVRDIGATNNDLNG